MLIGLTGGIASGKSLVSSYLKKLGAKVIDLDEIAREVVGPGLPAWKEIVEAFGKEVLTNEGVIDRKKLGNIVFNDHELLKKLNSITHPRIMKEARRRIEKIRQKEADIMIVVDAALLIESGYYKDMDKTILVYADEDIQIERLKKRDGISEGDALKRLKVQMPLKEKLLFADYVVYNNNESKEDIRRQTSEIFYKLKVSL